MKNFYYKVIIFVFGFVVLFLMIVGLVIYFGIKELVVVVSFVFSSYSYDCID